MFIIGVCGRKRHGKNALGKIIEKHYQTTPIAFADPLKKSLMDLYGFSYDQMFDEVLKEQIDPRWGFSPRTAMQLYGTEVVRAICKETWTRKLASTITAAANGEMPIIHLEKLRTFGPADPKYVDPLKWVVTDVRFPNEAQTIQSMGGKIIKVIRPSLTSQSQDMHSSETNIDDVCEDGLIINDGSLDDLEANLLRLLGEWTTPPRLQV